ncbi:protein-disulfide reductase DsbD [Ramlibacter aurantiacus]|nr:protein-disulfide reductase DsbD [Ramlibacter aurantiacus]
MHSTVRDRFIRAVLIFLLGLAAGLVRAEVPQQQFGAGAQSRVPAAESALQAIRSWLPGGSEPDLLDPEAAFQMEVRVQGPESVVATLTPAPNYYLYKDRISFKVVAPDSVQLAGVTLPAGKPKADPTFGTVEVFQNRVDAVLALNRSAAGEQRLQLQASYQGCNEPTGVCYPPIEKSVTIVLPAAHATASSAALTPAAPPRWTLNLDDRQVREIFSSANTWGLLAAFFGFGLLLAFTPCMLPMVPILSGIVVGSGRPTGRSHALVLSCAYVLGMALAYAAAGLMAGLAGTLVSAYLQNPWVLGFFAATFVLLALSMFGLYELQIPGWLQTRLAVAGNRLRGGRIAGVFAMGALSAVIMGPCVAAPLAGALLYIAQTRDVVLGGTALFSMAIGMGVPLLLVAASAGTLLPKAGAWMGAIKRVSGILMLAVAIYVLTPVVPASVLHLLWAALLVISAVYLRAVDSLPPSAPGHWRLFKGVGLLALVAGVALMLGALSGSRDILQPLSALRIGAVPAPGAGLRELQFIPVSTVAELDEQVGAARGRPVMLDFWAEWCVSCLEMDRFTFSDPRVQARLSDFVLLRADVTANTGAHRELLRRFSLFGPPGIIFFDEQGRVTPTRVIGFQDPEQFLASLQRISL